MIGDDKRSDGRLGFDLRFFVSAVFGGVLAVIALGSLLIYRYYISDAHDRETITFGVSIVGATVAIYGLLKAADNIRKSNFEKFQSSSLDFVKRWNSPLYFPLKTAWRELNESMDALSETERDVALANDVKKRNTAVEILNFFEEMATGANSGSLDDKLLRTYFETFVIKAFERYQYWIRQHRIRKTAPGYFDELEKLVREWKRAGS